MGEVSRRRFLVSGERQKNQLELAFGGGGRGEASKTFAEGPNRSTTERGTESPGIS